MTVASSLAKAGPYDADGVVKEFPFQFRALDPSHIKVVTEGGATSAYTVRLQGDGGVVTFEQPPADGVTLTVLRDVPITQTTDIQNNTAFFPEIWENGIDKLTMICQQMQEEIDRCAKASATSGIDVTEYLENLVTVTNNSKDVAFNAAVAAANSATDAANSATDAAESVEEVRDALRKSAGLPIGSIFAYPGAVPPEGAYLLNGQTIANCPTLYPKFWVWVQSAGVRSIDNATFEAELASAGVCGGFVIDASAGSVRLPSVTQGTLWGADSTNVGQSLAAGLPNIEGVGGEVYPLEVGFSGAFTQAGHIGSGFSGNSSGNFYSLGLDASLANPIYGNSDTVQPPAIRVSWCIQVFNAATALSEQESANLASLMQTKAQTDFGNVAENLDFVVESWQAADGSSWYHRYRSGWVEQGGIRDMGEVVYSAEDTPINFPAEMRDTQYSCSLCPVLESGSGLMAMVKERTNGYMTMQVKHRTDYATYFRYVSWYVCGYGATE